MEFLQEFNFFRQNQKAHIYGTSTANQRIECWWSNCKKSFSAWVIEYFRHMCDDDILNIGNTIHLECIWFVYADFLQSQLDEAVHEWNTHYIRRSRHDTVTGIPDVLFHVPSLGDYEDKKVLVNEALLQSVIDERYIF